MAANICEVLAERGLIHQCTDAAMPERMATPRTVYIGFDPTADSLHVGSLLPLMVLAHVQRCGHKPLVPVGGATGLVGDPSGKTETRKLLTREDVAANVAGLKAQIGRFLRFGSGPADAEMLDNADWLAPLGWIELLREVGPHFSVNRMLTMDSVKNRMAAGDGISFIEFNYMVMQAYDFAHLARTRACSIQAGGQDQWGNIVMGIELARRRDGADLAGLTFPLVTKADGTKFGKSESGAVWLDAKRTPVHDFFQFWRNADDRDVAKFLGWFTFLPMDEVRALTTGGGAALNAAKERLAWEVTAIVHGREAADRCQADARAAFGSGDLGGDSIPHGDLPAGDLAIGVGILVLGRQAGMWASNGEGRRLVQGGGVRLNDETVDDPSRSVTSADVRDGRVILRVGKKKVFRFDVR